MEEKKNTLVTIIVPIYNAEEFLEECLNSLVHQTYKNIELIFVDDGSTDNSLRIMKKVAENDHRVRIKQQQNMGVEKTRNTIIHEAKGEYVYFMDSDDWIENNTIERLVQVIEEYEADVVLFNYFREYSDRTLKKRIFDDPVIVFDDDGCKKLLRRLVGPYSDEEIAHPENNDAICTLWGKLYKKNIIIDNNVQYPSNKIVGSYGDGIYNMQYMLHVKKAVYINEYLYHYRKTNSNSIVTSYRKNLAKRWENQAGIILNFVKDNKLPEEYYVAQKYRLAVGMITLGINAYANPERKQQMRTDIIDALNIQGMTDALREINKRKMPLHWKIYFKCAERKKVTSLIILAGMIVKLKEYI